MQKLLEEFLPGEKGVIVTVAGEGRIERLGAPKDIPTYIAKIDKIISDKRALFGRG